MNVAISKMILVRPLMNFTCAYVWPLTSLAYEGSHVASISDQVWIKSDFNFASNESNFYLTF